MEDTTHIRQSYLDHDLLVRMDEKLNLLVKSKDDHELRLRRVEMWGFVAIGISYALQFYFNFVI